MKALKNCIRFLLPFFILQLLHFKYISILPDTAFMFAYQLPSHSTSFLDVCAQWLLPISAILYFSVYDTDFLYDYGSFIIPRLKSRNILINKLHLSGIILVFITCSIYFCGNVLLYFECFMQNSVTMILQTCKTIDFRLKVIATLAILIDIRMLNISSRCTNYCAFLEMKMHMTF